MKRLNLLLILSLSFLLFTNCEKNIPSIPTEEQLLNTNAKELFACLVNGEYWASNDISSSYSVTATTLNVEAYKESSHFINFGGFVPEIGYHTLSGAVMRNHLCSYSESEMDTLVNAINILRLDIEERLMIGTFEFVLEGSGNGCLDEIRITEGRFKIPF
ncbi:MAG: hypothetical protein MK226_21470 [Saprospiraceae bacterium]|nr:hypothetical protein [Saprospiraceae bacterium]